MRRRELLAALSTAIVGPVTARAQRQRPRRLGILLYTDPTTDPNIAALLQGLRDLGYVDGRDISIEFHSAQGDPERLPQLAADLVRTAPDIVFALGGDVAPFAAAATKTIPIVFAVSTNPVLAGLAASFARPGSNATGVSYVQDELAAKRLQLLKEAVPQASSLGFVWNPEHVDNELPLAEAGARALGLRIRPLAVRRASDLDPALRNAVEAGTDTLYAVSSRLTINSIPEIVEFASRNRLPLVGGFGAWAKAGGLLSYGPNVNAMVRRAAGHIDKILKGETPGLLPIEQPTRFHLVVNTRTATALRLTLPQSILAGADEVIE